MVRSHVVAHFMTEGVVARGASLLDNAETVLGQKRGGQHRIIEQVADTAKLFRRVYP